MGVNHDSFSTRKRIHVLWNGSWSGQMIRIRPDPDPNGRLTKTICFHEGYHIWYKYNFFFKYLFFQEGQTSAPGREDCVDYHFVAFVQVDGGLYELDGRKTGPVRKGASSPATFMKVRS